MSFEALKKNRAKTIEALKEKIVENSKTSYDATEGEFWSLSVDKAGNGYAVIRFLPAGEGENVPWIKYWDHGFQGPTGRWFIENSLTTLGQDDPTSKLNSLLWNSGKESDKDIARSRKRRLHYVSNIYVIRDPSNPDNDGKVFKFKYGKKIFDKISDLMQPQFEGEVAVNPFDFWEGADFHLKARIADGYRSYDKSEFKDATPLLGGDEDKLREIYEKLYPLAPIIDPSNFKTYAELKSRLKSVLGAEYIEVDTEGPDESEAKESTRFSREALNPAADGLVNDDDDGDDDGTDTDKGSESDGSVEDSSSFFRNLAAKKKSS